MHSGQYESFLSFEGHCCKSMPTQAEEGGSCERPIHMQLCTQGTGERESRREIYLSWKVWEVPLRAVLVQRSRQSRRRGAEEGSPAGRVTFSAVLAQVTGDSPVTLAVGVAATFSVWGLGRWDQW